MRVDGAASYGPGFFGRRTASETSPGNHDCSPQDLLGTLVRVTNLGMGRPSWYASTTGVRIGSTV